jgi:hypothetical protein
VFSIFLTRSDLIKEIISTGSVLLKITISIKDLKNKK